MTERKRRTSAERFVIIEVAKRMNDLHIDADSQTGIAIERRVNNFLFVSSHNKIKALGLTGDISKDAALLEAAEKAAWK